MKLKSKTLVRSVNTFDVFDISVPITENFILSSGEVVHNSKDIMDAVCGSIYGAYMDGDKAADLPRQYTDVRYANVISSIKAGKTNIQRSLQNTQNLWG